MRNRPEVTTFGVPQGSGARLSSFRTADGLTVSVLGVDAESTDAARALALELADHCATEPTRFGYADIAEANDFADCVDWVCTEVVMGRPVLGAKASVGAWTPAVAEPHGWAVLGLTGAPLQLAHDAFEAARWFCDYEAGHVEESVDIHRPTDAELSVQATERRYADHRWMFARYDVELERSRREAVACG